MKKSLLLFFAIATVSMTFITSCKKGSEDPWISLRSRDSRLEGDWKLTKYSGSITRTGTLTQDNYSYTYDFDGTQYTETFVGKYHPEGATPLVFRDTSWTVSYTYDRLLVINKDGTYKTNITMNEVKNEFSGEWKWLSGDKNKTILSADETYYLDGLSNKEMIASRFNESFSYYPIINFQTLEYHNYKEITDLKYNFVKQ